MALPPVPDQGSIGLRLLNGGTGFHTAVYKLSRGRLGARAPGGAKILLLDHVGAKSGKKRTTPLLYLDDGDDVAIVASAGGRTKHPAWFHNLKANPATQVQIGGERRRVQAQVTDEATRERLWPRLVEIWPDYAGYQERTDRQIPVILLTSAA